MLDTVGRMRNHAGDKDLALGQFDLFPNGVFVFMPRVRSFDQKSLRAHPQHQIDHFVELDVEGMGPCQLPQHRWYRILSSGKSRNA